MTTKICKLEKLKNLVCNPSFKEFLVEFDLKMNLPFEEKANTREKTLNLIAYKRRLFSMAAFLYDIDESTDQFDPDIEETESFNETSHIVSANGVACDYILNKYQEYILFKMTNQIIIQTGLISTNRLESSDHTTNLNLIEQINQNKNTNDEQKELVEVDQTKFNRLLSSYKENMDYFVNSKTKFTNELLQETQFTLLQFLKMTNSWKLRRFDLNIPIQSLKNSNKSYFMETIINVLKAYECIIENPETTIDYCSKAALSMRKFNMITKGGNNHLVNKFEMLIYDWLLSAQTHLWSNHQIKDIKLFNETLKNFESFVVNFPELIMKVKMYETVFMYTSNRNPIKLLKPTAKQTVFTVSNQEAYFSMSQILKKFRLQIID